MLTIDDRAGSQFSGSFDFAKQLKRAGVPNRVRRLPFGDFAFTGNGPDGQLRIGIERKTAEELLGAIMDNRFTGRQVPGLLRSYDIVIIVAEGPVWADRLSGMLMIGKWEAGRTRHRHLWTNYTKFQLTLALKAKTVVWPTRSKTETVLFLAALYDWFQKRWKDHHSVYTVDETKPEVAILEERTLLRRVAAQLPFVGWVHSKKAERYFPSIHAMMNASVEEWAAALHIKDGRKMAKTIVESIRSESIRHQLEQSLQAAKTGNVVRARFGAKK